MVSRIWNFHAVVKYKDDRTGIPNTTHYYTTLLLYIPKFTYLNKKNFKNVKKGVLKYFKYKYATALAVNKTKLYKLLTISV